MNATLAELTERENRPGHIGTGHRRRSGCAGRWWLTALVAVVGWSLWDAGIGRAEIVNPGGWTIMARFWRAAVFPDLSADYLDVTWRATLITSAFAVLGTALAVVIGLLGGLALSQTWWQRTSRRGLRPGWYLTRVVGGIPRGIHEAVWALVFVNIFGRDPIVGILALAIPFGAITAKVYAELVDEAAPGAFDALRAAGAGRVTALLYGIVPTIKADLVSYGFYRLECALRSAVILGMIGAGGIGFELSLQFQSLKYERMWTLIYALVIISAVTDAWGGTLRRKASAMKTRTSLASGIVLVGASALHLRPDLGRVFGDRARHLAADLVREAWPPSWPRGGWSELWRSSVDTLQMSILAIVLASALATAVAFVAARGGGPGRRTAAMTARVVLLVTRAIPPPVWALLVLFVIYPGPVPGAVALGIYNFGILGRLFAEIVENLDSRPVHALRAAGSAELSTFVYSTVPLSLGRFLAYALYRWEVALRETVIVGVVGAGGLGRLLEQQRAAFDDQGMLGTILALLVLSLLVDAVSATTRNTLT